MEVQTLDSLTPYLIALCGWVLTVFIPGLWAVYEKKRRVTLEDGIGILVDSIQKHSRETGDRKIKDDVKSRNHAPLNEIVKKVKSKDL